MMPCFDCVMAFKFTEAKKDAEKDFDAIVTDDTLRDMIGYHISKGKEKRLKSKSKISAIGYTRSAKKKAKVVGGVAATSSRGHSDKEGAKEEGTRREAEPSLDLGPYFF